MKVRVRYIGLVADRRWSREEIEKDSEAFLASASQCAEHLDPDYLRIALRKKAPAGAQVWILEQVEEEVEGEWRVESRHFSLFRDCTTGPAFRGEHRLNCKWDPGATSWVCGPGCPVAEEARQVLLAAT